MVRVRYPNGQVIQYNEATTLLREQNGWGIYANHGKKNERLFAYVQNSAGVIVEWATPCKVENPLLNVTGEKAVKYVIAHAEEISKTWEGARLLKTLKKELARYTPRSGKWK